MPIYEYQCTSCHHQFERLQKIHEAAIPECPNCSKPTAERLVSAAAFQLKGTGWYETDFKHKGKPEVKKAATDDAAPKKADATAATTIPTSTTTEG